MQSCRILFKNLGWRQNQWRMKTELAANTGILAPPSSHIKDQKDKAHAFQMESGAKHNYESILGCHTLECSEWALHTVLCVLPAELRMLHVVFAGSGP